MSDYFTGSLPYRIEQFLSNNTDHLRWIPESIWWLPMQAVRWPYCRLLNNHDACRGYHHPGMSRADARQWRRDRAARRTLERRA